MRAHVQALAILLALALLPTAQAHLSGFSQGTIVKAGPYSVAFGPSPESPFAKSSMGLTAQVSVTATGTAARNVAVAAQITGPQDYVEKRNLSNDGAGYFLALVTPPHGGRYDVRLEVTDLSSGEVHSGVATVDVYPELGFRLRSIDPELDITAGRTTVLVVETVDPATLARKAPFNDLTLVAEHWTTDHKTLLGVAQIPGANEKPGLFRFEHVFPEQGMYHLRFSSQGGDFKPDDVPMFHAIANPPVETPQETTPFPVLALLVALAVAARLRRG